MPEMRLAGLQGLQATYVISRSAPSGFGGLLRENPLSHSVAPTTATHKG